MGNPRYISGLSYNVGTCTAKGVSPSISTLSCINFITDEKLKFAPRPAGFSCPGGSKVQNYCDGPDPYCCTGSDQATHQGYGSKYGQQALAFIKSKLSGGTTNPPPTSTRGNPPPSSTPPPTGGTVPRWGQCGGQGWTGPTVCQSPYTCKAQNQWYSQCQ